MPNNSFRKVKVDKRSGFDKSFRNSLTGYCGTLVPILVDEIMPDTKIYLKEALAAALPPLVSDTYMNVRLRVEAFVVPHRLCQSNFDDFFNDYPVELVDDVSDGYVGTDSNGCMPLIRINYIDTNYPARVNWFGNGSLMDYFGIPVFADNFDFDVVADPFIAYHLIWQEWYRNPRVQKPAFVKYTDSVQSSSIVGDDAAGYFAFAPYTSFYFGSGGEQFTFKFIDPGEESQDDTPLKTYDGKYFCELRQRNFGLDFFTAAMVEPQQGPAAVVKFGQGSDPADGFTISSLRAQNSIQQFRERNNLTSPRYQQQIYARYGVAPSDGVIQRPVLIGAATYDVYSHGVTQTSGAVDEGATRNPFGLTLGARGGNGFASGNDVLIDEFHVKEPMYLIVLASLVPEVTYSQNFEPLFTRYQGVGSITDMANGILQNVGPQPIPKGFLGMADSKAKFYEVFAYTDRYGDWMIKNNQCHGEFKAYQSGTLDTFVSQRTFSGLPEFGSEFLEIPVDYLDGVMQYSSDTINLTYWLDISFDYKVSMPLQEYAIPSLQDPGYEHGRTISLRKNGQLL